MLFKRVCAAALLALVSVTPILHGGVLEDRGIEDAINRSFMFRELLIDRTMVRCYVRYGVVELRGQVSDEHERDLLGYFIAAIPEVKQVDNRLFVDSDTRRGSPRWHALRLRAQLLMMSRVDASQTHVDVIGERWQLIGEFADEASRQDLARSAQALAPDVPLILSVSNNATATIKTARIDDASIVAIVRSALETAPALTLTEAVVTCAQGKVTLRGNVRSVTDQKLAQELATASRGVLTVENRLSLLP